jgi:uncharacterized protein DUF3489
VNGHNRSDPREFRPGAGAVIEDLMHTFVIDAKNHVTAHAATVQVRVPKGGCSFAKEKELERIAAGWPGTRLVEIWNKRPNVNIVQTFTDRKTAVRRIWSVLQELTPAPAEQSRAVAPARGKVPAKKGRSRGRNGTKSERIIALLQRPAGATLNEIMAETGWQAHSVRGFISGQLSKRWGYRVESFKRERERVYRIRQQSV